MQRVRSYGCLTVVATVVLLGCLVALSLCPQPAGASDVYDSSIDLADYASQIKLLEKRMGLEDRGVLTNPEREGQRLFEQTQEAGSMKGMVSAMVDDMLNRNATKKDSAKKEKKTKKTDGLNPYPDFPGINVNGDPSIIKGKHDPRKYHELILPNGLRTLLISHPDTPKAAASMDAGCGYFNDPADVAGLAHFLEHMVFLGSEKYPGKEFESYIEKQGGMNNAYTSYENTNFFFDVLPNALQGAMDRFAQFFIAPTLKAEMTAKEMNAVNSEHAKNVLVDGWRQVQMSRVTSSKAHPYSKFGTGNKETLSRYPPEEMAKKLRALWDKCYTAKNLQLVVIGGHNLNTLAHWVNTSFAGVRKTPEGGIVNNLHNKYPSWVDTVYDKNMTGKAVYFEPVKDQHALSLQWSIPSQVLNYETGPLSFVGGLLDAAGKDTLASYLKKKGWVSTIETGLSTNARDFGLYSVEVRLLKAGIKHSDEILGMVFKAIELAKKNIKKWRFTEMKRLAQVHFDWRSVGQPQKTVTALSKGMRYVKKEHLVAARQLLFNFDPKEIRSLLDHLTPERAILFVASRGVAKKHKLTQHEKYYNIQFSTEEIPKALLNKWKGEASTNLVPALVKGGKKVALQLPKKNAWIPEPQALKIKPFFDLRRNKYRSVVSDGSAVHIAPPQVIFESNPPQSAVRIWHKQDAKFKRPVTFANFRLWSKPGGASALSAATALLYTQLLTDSLRDFLYPTGMAGYGFSLFNDLTGTSMKLRGYSTGLLKYFKIILKKMHTEFKPCAARFQTIRAHILTQLANQKFAMPYKHATDLTHLVLGQNFPMSEVVPAIHSLTLDDIIRFPRELLRDVRVEAFFNGNVYPWEAKVFVKALQKSLPFQTIQTAYAPRHRSIMSWKDRRPMLDGVYTVQAMGTNEKEVNSALHNTYQAGTGSDVDRVYCTLLDMTMNKPIYSQLRTKEQLGYIVWSSCITVNDVQEFHIQVTSSSYYPDYLNKRTEAFLDGYRDKLVDSLRSKPKEFIHQVIELYESKMTNTTTVVEDTNDSWTAIVSSKYNFLQRFVDAQLLFKKVTIDGFLDFFDQTFGFGKYPKRVLSVQVKSHVKKSKKDLAKAKKGAKKATKGKKKSKKAKKALKQKQKEIKKIARTLKTKMKKILKKAQKKVAERKRSAKNVGASSSSSSKRKGARSFVDTAAQAQMDADDQESLDLSMHLNTDDVQAAVARAGRLQASDMTDFYAHASRHSKEADEMAGIVGDATAPHAVAQAAVRAAEQVKQALAQDFEQIAQAHLLKRDKSVLRGKDRIYQGSSELSSSLASAVNQDLQDWEPREGLSADAESEEEEAMTMNGFLDRSVHNDMAQIKDADLLGYAGTRAAPRIPGPNMPPKGSKKAQRHHPLTPTQPSGTMAPSAPTTSTLIDVADEQQDDASAAPATAFVQVEETIAAVAQRPRPNVAPGAGKKGGAAKAAPALKKTDLKKFTGVETDRPVTLTVSYSKKLTKTHKISVALLPQIRTNLFMYPLRPAGRPGPMVPTPDKAPSGQKAAAKRAIKADKAKKDKKTAKKTAKKSKKAAKKAAAKKGKAVKASFLMDSDSMLVSTTVAASMNAAKAMDAQQRALVVSGLDKSDNPSRDLKSNAVLRAMEARLQRNVLQPINFRRQ